MSLDIIFGKKLTKSTSMPTSTVMYLIAFGGGSQGILPTLYETLMSLCVILFHVP